MSRRPPLSPSALALADTTVRRLDPKRLAWSWGKGLLLYALSRVDSQLAEPRYRWFVETFLGEYLTRKRAHVRESDECPPGLAALELFSATGRGEYRSLAEMVVRYLRDSAPTSAGGLNHFGSSILSRLYPQSMWVDSLMMYGVFAARWGRAMNDVDMTRFALEQPLHFARVLRDPATGLFRHCYWLAQRRAIPSGRAQWLRGNGWVLASLVEVLDATPADAAERAELVSLLNEVARAVVRHQLEDGAFPTLLGRASYVETSGTALCAYGLLAGVNGGYLPAALREPGARAYRAVLTRLQSSAAGTSLPEVSAATMPYPAWVYPLLPRVHDATYGVAAVLLAALAAERAGLE